MCVCGHVHFRCKLTELNAWPPVSLSSILSRTAGADWSGCSTLGMERCMLMVLIRPTAFILARECRSLLRRVLG